MEHSVLERGEPIGSLTMTQEGLFWRFDCQIEKDREQLRRIFVIHHNGSEYLGIPDAHGRLTARIPRSHLPDGITAVIASRHPRGLWAPWCGTVEGIEVAEAFLRPAEDGFLLALAPQEALKFPAWAADMKTEEVYGTQTALLQLDRDGRLPLIETEEDGGTENEATEEMDRLVSDDLLPADAPADDGFGSEWAEEADRSDL